MNKIDEKHGRNESKTRGDAEWRERKKDKSHVFMTQGRIQPGYTCTPLVSEYMFIVCWMLEAPWMFRQINGALSILQNWIQGASWMLNYRTVCILNVKLQKLECILNVKLQNIGYTPNFKLKNLGCTLNVKLQNDVGCTLRGRWGRGGRKLFKNHAVFHQKLSLHP